MLTKYNQGYAKDININAILPGVKAESKNQLFQMLSKEAVKFTGGSKLYLQQELLKQEEIHNSALGEHVATPNLKLRNIHHPVTVLATLPEGIEYDAADNNPVHIACLLLSPEHDGPIHLRRLSRIARHLKNPDLQMRIRETSDKETMRTLIMDPEGWVLAA